MSQKTNVDPSRDTKVRVYDSVLSHGDKVSTSSRQVSSCEEPQERTETRIENPTTSNLENLV